MALLCLQGNREKGIKMIILAIANNEADLKAVEEELNRANSGISGLEMECYRNIRTFEISYPLNIKFSEIEKRLSACNGLAMFFESSG